jgi:glucose/arabinose dehydrogenase
MPVARLLPALATVAVTVGALAGCTAPVAPETLAPSSSASVSQRGGMVPLGSPTELAAGLDSPWSMVRLISPDVTLVSERDSGAVERLTTSGKLSKIGTVPGVVHDGEGGLLGLAVLHDGPTTWLYAYETTATDNRIVRMTLGDEFALGAPHVILNGLAFADHHNGGRIAFGPDGMLYATVGDAGDTSHAQDLSSLNGKILRMTPTGAVPKGNPFPGSLIWSYGHRNPQGLAWDASGQLWASEFGQNTWDEFNRIVAGKDYGWPVVEGQAGNPKYVDPVLEWATGDASPSGLSYIGGTFFMAALRGERLWAIQVDASGAASAKAYFTGTYGRLRDAIQGPDHSLWILTDNTDGRGTPKPGDDRILWVLLAGATGAG